MQSGKSVESAKRLAIDVGGTFIDFVYFDSETNSIEVEKLPSSGQLERRFFEGMDGLGLEPAALAMIVHGSTLVLNTIIQETGARVALITTEGFRDVLELGRGNRPDVYDLFYKPAPPLVPRHLRFEARERLDHRGQVVEPLDLQAARDTVRAIGEAGVEAVAICFLHSYANPEHELSMAELVRECLPNVQVCVSSEIVREFREFERTSTTVLNAYTQPRMASYLSRLEESLAARDYRGAFTVMQSSGGITSSRLARQGPVRTIQSGPAGGVIGTVELGATLALENLVAADVGGTTFDVAVIAGGASLERTRVELGGRPVIQPTIDIASIGAGGGSIAHLDAEGGLKVGPKSAQADPGPACFGLGGRDATVTDAQLLLGYLDAEAYLGERMKLDEGAAREAVESLAGPLGLELLDAAAGILHLANMNMVYAIRQVTIERGHDPRDFSLVCYGGGGGLFAGALLDELDMRRAIVPVNPATFSAWGLLNADYREDVSQTFVRPLEQVTPEALAERFGELEREASAWFEAEHIEAGELQLELSAELRYLGQEHAVRIPVSAADLQLTDLTSLRERFDDAYRRAFAHSLPTHELEFVNLRLSAFGRTAKPRPNELQAATSPVDEARRGSRTVRIAGSTEAVECPMYARDRLLRGHLVEGPALVEEWNSTILILPGQRAEVDPFGNLLIERTK